MGSLLARRMDEAINESRVRGLAEGREQGLAEGREQGLAEGREQGFAEGREQGFAEGREQQRAMLLRLAARKFDANTAARFEALLAVVDDPGRLAGIVDHVIDSDDGDEMLSRVTDVAALH